MPSLLVWEGTVTDWTHIAVVYEDKQPRLYVNGTLVRTGLVSPRDHVNMGTFLGGMSDHPDYDIQTMDGQMDEVRVWNYIRTPEQIAANMNSTVPTPQSGLAAYWPINESDEDVLTDISGNGNDVELNSNYGPGNWSALAPSLASYKDGYRYGFNGQEHSKELGENSFTAEYWQYDARLGRRWNVDPRPNIRISMYACFANNPIFHIDTFGDTLGVSNNTDSRNDISSLVSETNKSFIDYDIKNNCMKLKASISSNGKEVSLEEAMKGDEGLRLLNDLSTDTKNYYYAATNTRAYDIRNLGTQALLQSVNEDISKRYPSGTRMDPNTPAALNPKGISYYETFMNLSFTPRGDEFDTNGDGIFLQAVPNKVYNLNGYQRKYDGVVYISPGEFYQQRVVNGQTTLTKTRAKVVAHELRENYLRVNGQQYTPAHHGAINMLRWPYTNGTPSLQRKLESGAHEGSMYGDSYYFIMK